MEGLETFARFLQTESFPPAKGAKGAKGASSVTVSWYYLKRNDGKLEKRFVLSTKPLKASAINWWGKRRWQIEGWFKTAKHRFGLHRFGQETLLGVYRWLILSFIAYILAPKSLFIDRHYKFT